MTPERQREVLAIVDEALARGDAERAAYLDNACAGDESLRREVDSLLAAPSQPAGVLDTPVWRVAAAPLPPGTRLGPYEVG